MANSVFIVPGVGSFDGGGNVSFTGVALFADGTAALPSIAFASEPSTGLFKSAGGTVGTSGLGTAGPSFTSTQVNVPSTGEFRSAGFGTKITMPTADGLMNIQNNANSIGVRVKVDALPTVGANFGTSPAVITGSTAFAGAVNVGTGGAAVSGTITFGGTAFPSAPFVVCTCSSGAVPTIATATVSGVTFTTSVAWPASTILTWHIVGARA